MNFKRGDIVKDAHGSTGEVLSVARGFVSVRWDAGPEQGHTSWIAPRALEVAREKRCK